MVTQTQPNSEMLRGRTKKLQLEEELSTKFELITEYDWQAAKPYCLHNANRIL